MNYIINYPEDKEPIVVIEDEEELEDLEID